MKIGNMNVRGGFAAGVLLALCGIASAAPLETITLPLAGDPAPLDSNGIDGSAVNRVTNFTPTSAGTVRSIRISGTLNSVNPGTWGNEARIAVTSPTGQTVTVPFFPGQFTFTTLIATNVNAFVNDVVANSGVWTVRFFETFNDGGDASIDATWADGLTIVLDDSGLPPVISLETITLPLAGDPAPLDSNGINESPVNRVTTFTPTTSGTVRSIAISGTLNSVDPGTFASEARIAVTTPSGQTVTLPFFPDIFTFGSETATNVQSFVTDVVANSGSWTVRFFETFNDGGDASIDATWADGLTIALSGTGAPAIISTPLGTLAAGTTTVNPVALNAGQVRYYSFTLANPVETGLGTFLDIDTETTLGGLDTEIGLFTAAGALLSSDDDSGNGLLSQLTYGAGTRCPVGTGFPYDGFNGPLPAGNYVLAVGLFNTVFADGPLVTSTSAAAGDVVLNLNLGTQGPATPPVISTALGAINITPAYASTTSVTIPAAGSAIISFSLPTGVDGTLREFLDIDTEGTVGGNAIVLYNATTGGGIAGVIGGGTGDASLLSFGSGYRAPAGPGGNAYDGGAALTLPPGDYLLYVISTPTSAFDGPLVCSTGPGGDATVNIRTGIQPAAVAPVAEDLGTFNLSQRNVSRSAVPLAANEVKWYRFDMQLDNTAADFYFDIDTEGSALAPVNDTVLLLYTETGDIYDDVVGGFGFDDDSGSGFLAMLTYGNAPDRPAPGDGFPYDNFNGVLPTGVYYLAVCGFFPNAYIEEFAVFGLSDETGTFNLNIQSAPAAPLCIADLVGGDGNPPGGDGVDGNDFQAFLNAFGAGSALADIVGGDGNPPGGDGADGNDFQAFLNAFGAGC